MKTAKGIIIAAMVAATIPCIAGPFDPPRLPRVYPPPNLTRQLQQFRADNERRQMGQTLRQLRERDMRLLQQTQADERREKQTLESLRQSAARSEQK